MNVNYTDVSIIAAIVVVLIIFLIWRNQKDKKKYINSLEKSELKPENHKDKEGKI